MAWILSPWPLRRASPPSFPRHYSAAAQLRHALFAPYIHYQLELRHLLAADLEARLVASMPSPGRTGAETRGRSLVSRSLVSSRLTWRRTPSLVPPSGSDLQSLALRHDKGTTVVASLLERAKTICLRLTGGGALKVSQVMGTRCGPIAGCRLPVEDDAGTHTPARLSRPRSASVPVYIPTSLLHRSRRASPSRPFWPCLHATVWRTLLRCASSLA